MTHVVDRRGITIQKTHQKYRSVISILFFLSVCASCSTIHSVQPQVRRLVSIERYAQALKVLDDNKGSYSTNSELLYLLDRGYVLHVTGKYAESIEVFDKAKLLFDQLYTQSVTRMAASWLWNDYTQPYCGEDFERVLINIFQALNYCMLDKWEDALVEARDVDSILNTINARYDVNAKNAYTEDAFARLLMGIIYEASGGWSHLEDAFIDYRKAIDIYEGEYLHRYGVTTPLMVKENFASVGQFLKRVDGNKIQDTLKCGPFTPLEDKKDKAVVYVIVYSGTVPVKYEDSIILPLPDGNLTKFAFPGYEETEVSEGPQTVIARSDTGSAYSAKTELVNDITAIARRNLNDRRARVLFKAVARPAAKYWLLKKYEEEIEKKKGKTAAYWFKVLGDMYVAYAERADLRSWQTLPAHMYMACFIVAPGHYTFQIDRKDIGSLSLRAGETRFIIK